MWLGVHSPARGQDACRTTSLWVRDPNGGLSEGPHGALAQSPGLRPPWRGLPWVPGTALPANANGVAALGPLRPPRIRPVLRRAATPSTLSARGLMPPSRSVVFVHLTCCGTGEIAPQPRLGLASPAGRAPRVVPRRDYPGLQASTPLALEAAWYFDVRGLPGAGPPPSARLLRLAQSVTAPKPLQIERCCCGASLFSIE